MSLFRFLSYTDRVAMRVLLKCSPSADAGGEIASDINKRVEFYCNGETFGRADSHY